MPRDDDDDDDDDAPSAPPLRVMASAWLGGSELVDGSIVCEMDASS